MRSFSWRTDSEGAQENEPPASLQASVSNKTVPIAGQNKFSKVEAADGTFFDKIPIAAPDLFNLISEHKETPVNVLLTSDGAPYLSATQGPSLPERWPQLLYEKSG